MDKNKKNTSFREMLRDRCPYVVNLALKWCKAKDRWIEHTYNHFVKIYISKKDRYEITRIILGISTKYRSFDFNKTIDWENLDPEEIAYWEDVKSWVNWFSEQHMYIEDAIKQGYNDDFIKSKYLPTYDKAKELIDFIKQNI